MNVGGLPCTSRPMRNTFAENQSAPSAAAKPIAIVSQTCHAGGGEVDVILNIIANVLIGGRKLNVTLNAESGAREIGIHSIHGMTISRMIGVIIVCASRSSFT